MTEPLTEDDPAGGDEDPHGDPHADPHDDPADLGLLPAWYMPAPMVGAPLLHGWRRRVALLIVASFVLLSAYGLCSTYGWVGFG